MKNIQREKTRRIYHTTRSIGPLDLRMDAYKLHFIHTHLCTKIGLAEKMELTILCRHLL